MDLKINSAQPNFRAKMQLRGNIRLLKNGEVEVLKHRIDKIGTESDVIVINIPIFFDKAISIKGFFNDERPEERLAKVHYNFEIFPNLVRILDDIATEVFHYGKMLDCREARMIDYTKSETPANEEDYIDIEEEPEKVSDNIDDEYERERKLWEFIREPGNM